MKGVYRAAERSFRPWKNGGGETAEIIVSPPCAGFSDFDWRISTATVAQDGPFSEFPNVDRVLTIIDGGPMQLTIGGQTHLLDDTSPPFAFPGDQPVSAELKGGPLLDFNVMTRRPLRAEVTRGPLARSDAGAAVRLAFLLAPAGGLSRLDLVDLDGCDPGLLAVLTGVSSLSVAIWPFSR